jgi:hypothetical protein
MNDVAQRSTAEAAQRHPQFAAIHVELLPMVVETYVGAPARLQAALVALTRWLDPVLLTIDPATQP